MSHTDPKSAAMNPRFSQMFPTLSPGDLERMRKFGVARQFADGDKILETGKVGPGLILILTGHVCVTQRDGFGHVTPIVEHGPGQFLGEVGQLSGRAALVDAHAEDQVDTVVIAPDKLRGLMIAEADLGERIMRALILRRVGLIQSGSGGPLIVGSLQSADVVRLQGFLTRNGYPHHLLDPAKDEEAASFVAASPTGLTDLPWVITADGTVLHNPSENQVAQAVGMVGTRSSLDAYDVAIVGGGPAGLATAVYAASEGLSVVVLDARAYGGQAGASARIENYLGFPTGISGGALTGRAFVQAQKFGAEMMIPVEVKSLDCSRPEGLFELKLDNDNTVRSRAVVVASGARYRRPAVADLESYEGKGIWYWASPIEGALVAGKDVIVVGGGNSAGQAAVYLSSVAASVHILIRADSLSQSMSRYLIERIESAPNIELHANSEIVRLTGSAERGLERVTIRNRVSEQDLHKDIGNVFLFVGADPATGWLAGCGVDIDKPGFVVTGRSPSGNLLETSVPGVFAVGDVRSSSVKRVGAAIGEGAQVVAALHGYLSGAVQSTA